ncbi:MAG TPA: phytanoyl-CoA dioxygenase family protein [Bacteroidota bacterium]
MKTQDHRTEIEERTMENAFAGLSKEYPLTEVQREAFRRDGHIVLRGVCPADALALFRPRMLEAVRNTVKTKNTHGKTESYAAMFTQVSNLWQKDPIAREFVFAERFAKLAADLMGVRGVRLYHDQALVKEPGGKPTPWHQDQFYWPMATDNTVTMWMPLIDVPREMGAMSFASTSHKDGLIGNLPISEAGDTMLAGFIREKNYAVTTSDLKAGDATFHYGLTLHSAHPNSSDRRREVMTIIYYEDGARINEPDNEYRKVDLAAFYPGQKPGDVAATELNPLLYKDKIKGS